MSGMKIVELIENERKLKLVPQNLFDILLLEETIEKNDLVGGKCMRNIFLRISGKKEKVGRRFVYLRIKVEKVKFDKARKMLRIKGRIVEAPEDVGKGSYHTFEVKEGSLIEIWKNDWNEELIEKLKKVEVSIASEKIVNEFLVSVRKGSDLVLYGIKKLKIAARINAVKVLLVCEEILDNDEVKELIETVRKKGGKILIVKNGKKEFCKVYRVGAILRFKVML